MCLENQAKQYPQADQALGLKVPSPEQQRVMDRNLQAQGLGAISRGTPLPTGTAVVDYGQAMVEKVAFAQETAIPPTQGYPTTKEEHIARGGVIGQIAPRKTRTMLQMVNEHIAGLERDLAYARRIQQRMIAENVHRLPENYFSLYAHPDDDNIPF